jgi:hypothetical protein
MANAMKGLTAYSWGYWGWGNHAGDFVRAVDGIERARGKRPPVFADIRFSRSVRAQGFRGAVFEETVGKNRYRWLRKLGNARIGSGRGGIRIADPSGADELLDLVIDADRDRRRVIFFCACEDPAHCHRAKVASLIVDAARKRGLGLMVIEWPGGDPEIIKLGVSAQVIKGVLGGGNRVPLLEQRPALVRKLQALPWCSRVALHSDGGNLSVVSGPARLATSWFLPVVGPDVSKPTDTIESIRKEAERLRKTLGYLPIGTAGRRRRGGPSGGP